MAPLMLPDGRRLGWEEQGDPHGLPVLSLHGSPGSRLTRPPMDERFREAGIRMLTFDRPGYGESDPLPGRSVADVASDVVALLDSLGLDRVAVSGASGGGPHALALATLVPERCTVVHCFVGVAPYEALGETFSDGMDAENVRRTRAARRGRAAAADEFGADMATIVAEARDDPGNVLSSMDLPASDRAILRAAGTAVSAGLVEAGRQGPWGFLDDFIAITSPWGFDPAGATAPLVIEYGRHDVNVPPAHGDWLAAHVPHVELRVNEGQGHLRSPEERFAELVALARRPAPTHD